MDVTKNETVSVEKRVHKMSYTHRVIALAEEQIVSMRVKYRNGDSMRSLAFEFHISEVDTGRIIRGEMFQECGGPITPTREFGVMARVRLNRNERQEGFKEFDEQAEKLVNREVSFDAFAKHPAVSRMLDKMVWKSEQRRAAPPWLGPEDLKNMILRHFWYYAFEHKCRDGRVGCDPSQTSPGAFLRWNAYQHLQKEIGKARGENMHAHRMFGPKPEVLSPTGDLTRLDKGTDDVEMETQLDNQHREKALARVAEAAKAFAVQNEMVKSLSGRKVATKKQVAAFILEQPKNTKKVLGVHSKDDAERVSGYVYDLLTHLGGIAGAKNTSEAKKCVERDLVLGAHRKT